MFINECWQWLKCLNRRATNKEPGQRRRSRPRPFLPQLEALEDRTLPAITLNPTTWTAIGPAPSTNGQIPGGGAVSGRITGVAPDITDPNTIFIATAGGGVWKTTDGGTSWNPLTDNLTDSSSNPIPLFMGAIAETHDGMGNEVVYAGTGEADNAALGYIHRDDAFAGEGILVSTDGGQTWSLTGQPQFQGTSIARIAIDPQDPNTAYAAVSNFAVNSNAAAATGIFKTTNGGGIWSNVTAANGKDSTDPWSDVVIDPTTTGNTAVLFAAVGKFNGAAGNGVYESTDGGTTWALVGGGMPSGTNLGVISLAIAHPVAAPQATLYASISQAGSQTPAHDSCPLRNLERSTDGGTTWTDITLNLNGDDYLQNRGWYSNVIEIDPTNPNEVFAAGDQASVGGIVESQDGGVTWTDGTTHPDINTGTAGTNGPHTDYHALAFDASGRLVVGNDGGVWRLDSNDLTTPNIAWTDLNTTLQITQFYGIAMDPTNANVGYGGTQDNGRERFTGTLVWGLFAGGDGGITRLDPTNNNRLYEEYVRISLETLTNPTAAAPAFTDITSGIAANNTGSPPTPIVHFYAPYVLDSSGDILYGTDYLNLSTNQGGNWTQIGTPGTNNFNPNDSPIDAIAVAPSDKAVVYVSVGGKMFVTQNATAASATWTEIDLPSGAAGALNSIAVDPSQPGTAYAVVNAFTTGGKHVFVTTNFGGTWNDISGNLPNFPVDSIAIDPRGTSNSRIIYIGTDVGVYASVNGGATWTPYQSGLPNVQVMELEVVPALGILAAGTHGRGVYEIQLYPTTTVSLDGSGNLVIQDIVPGGKNDNLTIQANATTSKYVISDPTAFIGIVGAVPGATVSADNHTAFVPFAAVTGTLINVNTVGGNDKLTVDYSLGNFAKTVNYDGGTGTNNMVVEGVLPGGPFTTETDTATGAGAGTIVLDSSTLEYQNLQQIIDTATATNFTIKDPLAGDTSNIENDPSSPENGFATSEINGGGFAKVDFANKTNATLTDTSGVGGDTFNVMAALLNSTSLTINGSGTGNTLNGPDQADTWNITASNGGNVTGLVKLFSDIQNLTGGTGQDVFAFKAGGNLTGHINGGGGSDWLVYTAISSSISVKLSTGKASLVAGGVSKIHNVIGSANGGDSISGDSTGGVLVGHNQGNTIAAGSGRSLLIGGFGKNLVAGAAGDDIVIGGKTSFDADMAALVAILAEWQGPGSFGTRVNQLKAGVVDANGHLDRLVLNATVFCTGRAPGPRFGRGGGAGQSTLVGGSGFNWFFTLFPSTIIHLKNGDRLN